MTLEQFKEKHGWDPERDIDLVLKAEQKYPDDEELKKSELKQQVVIRDLLEDLLDDRRAYCKKKAKESEYRIVNEILQFHEVYADSGKKVYRKETTSANTTSFKGEYFREVACDFVINNQEAPANLMSMLLKLWSNTYSNEDYKAIKDLIKDFLTKLSWE